MQSLAELLPWRSRRVRAAEITHPAETATQETSMENEELDEPTLEGERALGLEDEQAVNDAEPVTSQAAGEPPETVTAEALYAAFAGNQLAAEARYGGRVLRVQGTVAFVRRHHSRGIDVALKTSDYAERLLIAPAKPERRWPLRVAPGETVTVDARVESFACIELLLVEVADQPRPRSSKSALDRHPGNSSSVE
ncbi:MAG: hypothetical protein H6739_04840 [Alphaproteobacteria bacterium]|nr:hypothetical protein [Alphaproteobacteria bacterium]